LKRDSLIATVLSAAAGATFDATWKYSPSGEYMEVNDDTVARDAGYAAGL